MKIAVIGAKGMPARQGGIEHHCQELYPRMVERGHQVDLYARSSYTRSLSHNTVNGVRVISLPSLSLKGFDALSCSLLGTLSTIVGFRTHPYDIVHFHALGPSLFCGLSRLGAQAGVVATCHGLDWARAKWGKASRWLLRQGERAALDADAIIVVSEELQAYFQATHQKATTYIPNAPARYYPSNGLFQFGRSLGLQPLRYFLFLGRLVPEKRLDLLLEAFVGLNQSDWKLVIAGSDSDSRSYAQMLKQNYTQDSILFAGELTGTCLAEIVRGAGLLVLPSDLEGMPLALLEAMNEGVPVLASDLGVHRRLTANGRGLLFEVGNLTACRERMRWAMTHTTALERMAETAKQHVQTSYDWDQIVDQTLHVYEQLSLLKPAHQPKGEVSHV